MYSSNVSPLLLYISKKKNTRILSVMENGLFNTNHLLLFLLIYYNAIKFQYLLITTNIQFYFYFYFINLFFLLYGYKQFLKKNEYLLLFRKNKIK